MGAVTNIRGGIFDPWHFQLILKLSAVKYRLL